MARYDLIQFIGSIDLAVDNQVYEVTLEPGDILIVPPKWWHYVESLETSLSVNTWIPLVKRIFDWSGPIDRATHHREKPFTGKGRRIFSLGRMFRSHTDRKDHRHRRTRRGPRFEIAHFQS